MSQPQWPAALSVLVDDPAFLSLVKRYVEERQKHRDARVQGGRDLVRSLDASRRTRHNAAAWYLVNKGLAGTLEEARHLVRQCADAVEGRRA